MSHGEGSSPGGYPPPPPLLFSVAGKSPEFSPTGFQPAPPAEGRWPQGCHGFRSPLSGYWVAGGGGGGRGEGGPTVGPWLPGVARAQSSTRAGEIGRGSLGKPEEGRAEPGAATRPSSQHLPSPRVTLAPSPESSGQVRPRRPTQGLPPCSDGQREDLRHFEEGTRALLLHGDWTG